MLKYNSRLCILFTIIFFSCRTMGLNQTAETLNNGEMESTFIGGAGISMGSHSAYIPWFLLKTGFQQRFYIYDSIEIQLFILNEISIFPFYSDTSYIFFLSNYLKISPKFGLFKDQKSSVAMLPLIGVYNQFYHNNFVYLGPTTGF